VANVAVREFVSRFQDARPSALALARQATKSTSTTVSKKRKQDDAEISEAGSQRVTRSRTARSSNPPGNGMANSPVEVLDSEDDGDGEFVPDEIPEGMVACPVCSAPMKEEQMWAHLAPGGSCPGAENATGGRSSKSK
jgi:E3 ubiquitin-protein ligase RAD18